MQSLSALSQIGLRSETESLLRHAIKGNPGGVKSLPALLCGVSGYAGPAIVVASKAKPTVGSFLERQKKELPRSLEFKMLALYSTMSDTSMKT